MAFDKQKYWATKKDNVGSKRLKPVITPHISLGLTRKESRRKIVAKIFRFGDSIGKKHTAKGVRRAIMTAIIHPAENPSITNHQRVSARRAARMVHN